ncbi:MAG: glycosyltransferase [Methanobrevibacter sp.]|nr:glycosyltransferase [Methanobrevibacter sp.]
MVKVSVVIPVYNVEDYLEECLDSIVNQTLKDIEIICVNDGSSDGSLDILNEYAAKDNRFSVYTQENGGHAVATNRGMKYATGKYLYLMDSDDILKVETALEDTYKIAEEKNLDFVLFQSVNYYMDKNQYIKKENYSMNALVDFIGDKVFNWKDIKDYIFTITVTPWSKLYNREFIEKCGAKFPEGLVFEDNVFFWEVLFSAERIYFHRQHYFVRRWHSSSFTVSGGPQFKDSIDVMRLVWEVFKKFGVFHEFEDILYHKRIDLGYMRFTLIRDEFKQDYLSELKKSFNEIKQESNFDEVFERLSERDKAIFNYTLDSATPEEYKSIMEDFDSGRLRRMSKRDPNAPIKISIMMPVYNLENYLERSIGSIIIQTLDEIELICVNDGSADNSLEILREYEEKYNFIKVFTQENQGAGPALNRCISEASGEYIAFLDADDVYMDKTALEKMYNYGIKNNADIVAANLKRTNLKGDSIGNFNYDMGNYAYCADYGVMSPKDYGIPWAFYKNIYKKSFLDEKDVRFPPYKRGVDPVFLAKALAEVSEIYTVPVDLYGYNYSIGGGFNNKLFDYSFKKNHLIAFKSSFDTLENAGFDKVTHRFKKELITYLTHFGNENDLELFNLVHEVYGEDERYFDDYSNEFMLYKVKLILNNINSQEFFIYAKNTLSETPIWENDLLDNSTIREIFVVLSSNSFEEYELNLHKFIINEASGTDLISDKEIFNPEFKEESLSDTVSSLTDGRNSLNENMSSLLENNEKLKLKIYKLIEDNKYLKKEVQELSELNNKNTSSTGSKIKKTLRLGK